MRYLIIILVVSLLVFVSGCSEVQNSKYSSINEPEVGSEEEVARDIAQAYQDVYVAPHDIDITDEAIEKGDMGICYEIDDQWKTTKRECLTHFGCEKKDEEICKEAATYDSGLGVQDSYVAGCFECVAKAKADVNICEFIEDKSKKDRCIKIITDKSMEEVYCWEGAGIKIKGKDYNGVIFEVEPTREYCNDAIDNPNKYDKYPNDAFTICKYVAFHLDDPTVCDELTVGWMIPDCKKAVSKAKQCS